MAMKLHFENPYTDDRLDYQRAAIEAACVVCSAGRKPAGRNSQSSGTRPAGSRALNMPKAILASATG
jgi:hypothetical protein